MLDFVLFFSYQLGVTNNAQKENDVRFQSVCLAWYRFLSLFHEPFDNWSQFVYSKMES